MQVPLERLLQHSRAVSAYDSTLLLALSLSDGEINRTRLDHLIVSFVIVYLYMQLPFLTISCTCSLYRHVNSVENCGLISYREKSFSFVRISPLIAQWVQRPLFHGPLFSRPMDRCWSLSLSVSELWHARMFLLEWYAHYILLTLCMLQWAVKVHHKLLPDCSFQSCTLQTARTVRWLSTGQSTQPYLRTKTKISLESTTCVTRHVLRELGWTFRQILLVHRIFSGKVMSMQVLLEVHCLDASNFC